jgi:hypothetical protein
MNVENIEHYINEYYYGHKCFLQGANEAYWGDAGINGKNNFLNRLSDPTQGPSSSLLSKNFCISLIRHEQQSVGNLPSSLSPFHVDIGNDITYRISARKKEKLFEEEKNRIIQTIENSPGTVPVLCNPSSNPNCIYVCTSAIHCGGRKLNDKEISENQSLANGLCEAFINDQYVTLAKMARKEWEKEQSKGESKKKIAIFLTLLGSGAYKNERNVTEGIMSKICNILCETDVEILLCAYDETDKEIWQSSLLKGSKNTKDWENISLQKKWEFNANFSQN